VKIAVLLKRVPDTASVFKIGGDGKSVELGGLKFIMSPYDDHAVEQAMQLKEANSAEVVVVCLGPAEAKETIRSGLAMGADSGLLVTGADVESLTSKGTAIALAAALKTLEPDLILAGKQAVDDDASQVPERIAELMGLSHVSVITRFELDGATATVDRDIEGGHYTYEVPLPAVFTTQKALNTPRYPTLPNIMKAKKKPIEEVDLASLNIPAEDLAPGLVVESMALPRQERLGKIIEGDNAERVQELIKILREEEKVL